MVHITKKTRFTETQIVSVLKQHEAGRSVKDLAREHGISDATFYNWKANYGSTEASDEANESTWKKATAD